ncbi:redox-regulated ATPase YchF [candidate division WOR-3 bacterium]|uniref:Redox-regulated ATPase YchF n=1 Tax=candidate division WOR-3 bacterium TaxID=2052148 RepID=A0A938BSY2_UNCW3|nr:redox-regulated ATPase YchF [candidate division WOR-3 bacterium]
MVIGVFGLSASGKTTLFSLLTGMQLDPATRRKDGVTGTALVHDPRVDELASIFNPKKVTQASLTFTDMPGFDLEATRGEKSRVMQFIQNSDALLCVVRAFVNPAVAWPAKCDTPAAQLDTIRTELLLRDLAVVENRLERIAETERKRHKLSDEEQKERKLLTAVREQLEDEQPVSRQELTPAESKTLGTYCLFTAKPIIVAVNTDEHQLSAKSYPDQACVKEQCSANGFAYIELSGKIESDISQFDETDRELFLREYGFTESGIQRLSRVVYEHVGLISFLTVGEDEVKAWTIRRNTCARDAAGAIHTRLAETFVRAEVIPHKTFMAVGCMKRANAQNLVRLAGKDEIVNDGDIFHVRASG